MNRREQLLPFVRAGDPDRFGIEIGPWFDPLFPKREGYRCLSLDLFDAAALRERAARDPNVPREKIGAIEEVDLLGPASEIDRLVEAKYPLGTFDYIVSSHNFEHLPNPIGFLRACARVLKPEGRLSMVIPDLRTCFDYFRPPTTLAAWLEADLADRKRPTPAQIFEEETLHAGYLREGKPSCGCSLSEDPVHFRPSESLACAWERWKASAIAADASYVDTHCSAFTPASFELLVRDLRYLGLSEFAPLEISGPLGLEFFAHLQKQPGPVSPEEGALFFERRRRLLFRIKDELAANAPGTREAASGRPRKGDARVGGLRRLRSWEKRLRPLWKGWRGFSHR